MNKPMLKKFYLFVSSVFIFLIHIPFVFAKMKPSIPLTSAPKVNTIDNTLLPNFSDETPANVSSPSIYDSLKLSALGLSRQAFDYAMRGFNYLQSVGKLHNNSIISIADFSLSSAKKRLFILDLKNYKVLFNTYVAHGKNSGSEYATDFSNQPESFKSSLGFYVTQETYNGNHGYSLKLEGEERGINDNAANRAIVMHSAWYVNENIARSQGYIGRSEGCPAISETVYKPVIEKIKNGTCLFLYSPDKYYMSHSRILNNAA